MERIELQAVAGSFRDPSGFVFVRNGTVYRQVNVTYQQEYDALISSGLCETLVEDGLLVSHEEVDLALAGSDEAYKILRPEQLAFISYPYEWSFGQLKEVALTTLKIQTHALQHDMSLKDASAYNVQFHHGVARLIDTLSFERYCEGKPWVAYRQFCRHFLAPLALMAYVDVRLGRLLQVHLDGVPLDLASRLLPLRTWFVPSLLTHIHLHARAQRRYAGRSTEEARGTMKRVALRGLVDSLQSAVSRLEWTPAKTEWAEYYTETNYTDAGFEHKQRVVATFLDRIEPPPELVWDLGANVGIFSRIATERGIQTVAFDNDPAAVERHYRQATANDDKLVLPLLLDLTNPSPGVGWQHEERDALIDRGPADTVFALALIHHLAITNNVPLPRLATFFDTICGRYLLIEFVPKDDSQVQRLLASREDIFETYTEGHFREAFARYFRIEASEQIKDSARTLYLMRKRTINYE